MKKNKPVTAERIEAALDRLAHAMVAVGDVGIKALPIYERLERELETLRSANAKMASVRARLTRLRGQTEGQPAS